MTSSSKLERPVALTGSLTRAMQALMCSFVAAMLCTPAASASTLVGGSTTGTWSIAGSPYVVVSTVAIPSSQTLTVDPGVEIRIRSSGSIYVEGTFNCNGHSDSTITITSDLISPTIGSWSGIYAASNALIILKDTHISYGGSSGGGTIEGGPMSSITWEGGSCAYSGGPGISVDGDYANVTIHNVNIKHNGSLGDTDKRRCGLYIRTYDSVPSLDRISFSYNNGFAAMIEFNVGSLGTMTGHDNGLNVLYINASLGASGAPSLSRWSASPDLPYCISGLYTPPGSTWELGPGTVVKMLGQVYCQGTMRALGEPEAPIWITSLRDDEHGGDSNQADGNLQPGPGDWWRIAAMDTLEMHHTFVRYGGGGGGSAIEATGHRILWDGGGSSHCSGSGAYLLAPLVTLSNLTFDSNGSDGLHAEGYPVTIDNISGRNNKGYPISLDGAGDVPASVTGSFNKVNGIRVNGFVYKPATSDTCVWEFHPNLPYVVDNFLEIPLGETLKIQAGSVIKVASTGIGINVRGTLISSGIGAGVDCEGVAEDSPVFFTSLKDDLHGGDTNGDVESTTPLPGDWGGLIGIEHATIRLNQTWILYTSVSAIGVHRGTLVWSGGGVGASAGSGVVVTSPDSVMLSNVRLSQNPFYGVSASVLASNSRIRAMDCDFSENGGFGVRTLSTSGLVDAKNCWWGDPAGPLDTSIGNPDYNPEGLGSAVSDFVDYRPFQLSSTGIELPPGNFFRLNPLDDAVLQIAPIQFHWSASVPEGGGAVKYVLAVDDDPGFGSPEVDVNNLTGTTYLTEAPLTQGATYYWKVTAVDDNCRRSSARNGVGRFVASFPVSDSGTKLAGGISVGNIWPSPTWGPSSVEIRCASESQVEIEIFDVAGRVVRRLGRQSMPSGVHRISWDANSDSGTPVGGGIYFVSLSLNDQRTVRRLVVLGK